MIKSSSIVLFCAAALASLGGTAEAGLFDGANETIADLKTIEPVECGKALAALAEIWVTERDCMADFDAIADFFGDIKFPSLSIEGGKLSFDRGALPDRPDVDFAGICADGGCITKVADLHVTIDETCKPDSLSKISPEAAYIIRALRAFTNTVCVKNEDGEFCLENFLSDLKEYNPLDDGKPAVRAGLCSDCSKDVQAGLFGALAPDFAYNVARMYCLTDEDGGFCPADDLFLGASKAKVPGAVWGKVYSDEDICGSFCAAQALAIAGGEPVEECFEDEDRGFLSYSFSFVGQKTGLTREGVADVVTALEEDVGDAVGLFKGYVDVAFEEGGNFVVGLKKRFVGTNETDRALSAGVSSAGELEAAIETSPLIETNKVADDVTDDPTQSLEVKGDSQEQDPESGSHRASAVAAVMIVAVSIGGIAL